jgi:hypothetical protein
MNIEKRVINILNLTNCSKESIIIDNSIIDILDLRFTEYRLNVSIINCHINNLMLHTSWFKGGFLMENCIIKDKINYEMGGHNESPIVIRKNLFCDIFIFFDCQFINKLIINNNIFLNGCTLIGESMNNTFKSRIEIGENIGNMNINKVI